MPILATWGATRGDIKPTIYCTSDYMVGQWYSIVWPSFTTIPLIYTEQLTITPFIHLRNGLKPSSYMISSRPVSIATIHVSLIKSTWEVPWIHSFLVIYHMLGYTLFLQCYTTIDLFYTSGKLKIHDLHDLLTCWPWTVVVLTGLCPLLYDMPQACNVPNVSLTFHHPAAIRRREIWTRRNTGMHGYQKC